MKDAQILEAMRNKELDNYYLKQSPSENYDECFEKIDNETSHIAQELIEIVKFFSDKYKIDELKILRDMIYPTLEEGVTR